MEQITDEGGVVFTRSKDTLRKHRYDGPLDAAVNGSLYIDRMKFGGKTPPSKIVITVVALDE